MAAERETAEALSLPHELLRHYARQVRRVPLPVFIGAALVAAMAWHQVPTFWLASWLALVACVLALRWVVLGRLPGMNQIAVERRLLIAAGLSLLNGVVHGLCVAFLPYMSELQRSVQTLFLLGLCAGAVATTAGYMPVFMAYMLPTLAPLCVMWASSPGDRGSGPTTAVLIALFALVLLALARDACRLLASSLEIRLQQIDLNRRLRLALDEAEAASRSKTRFLASASHDLRQPMHTLTLFAAALTMRPLDPPTKQIALHMNTALQALASQLDALLDMSRLDAGVVQVRSADVALGQFLRRLCDELAPGAHRKGLALHLAGELDLHCQTDSLLLERVVRNLVDNAIKYTSAGSVTVRMAAAEGGVELRVIDTGCGIPPDEQARVFEEFYQLNNPERDRTRGLGLGLSIVQRLVALLGLRMTLRSTAGEGTEITLVLPQAQPDEPAPTQAPAPMQALGSLRVLVVDDEESVREGMRTLLEAHGCRVTLASGQGEALELARGQRPQIVLADLRLRGGEDGITVIRALRALHPGLPALLVSGDTAPQQMRAAQDAGVRLLHKPVQVELLTRAIRDELDSGREHGSAGAFAAAG
jgi:signal transduction histidine kinase/ActR/RegA family two-component response regulator